HRGIRRRVLAESERAPTVHVDQIRFRRLVLAVGIRRLVRITIDRPAFRATLTVSLRILRRFALGTIERGEVTAHTPGVVQDAVRVGAAPAGADELNRLTGWRRVDLGLAGFGWVCALFNSRQQFLIAPDPRAPQASVLLVHRDRVATERHAMILGR